MAQTSRRRIIKTIEPIIAQFVSDQSKVDDAAQQIADAIISIGVTKRKPAFDVKQADPFWTLAHGGSIDQSQVDEEKIRREAFSSFESCLQLPGSWSWYSSKTADDKALAVLREHVISEFKKDKQIFQKYQTWRMTPYARGAMSNLSIKRTPEQFVYSWSDFLASYQMNEKKVVQYAKDHQIEVDENGIPRTY